MAEFIEKSRSNLSAQHIEIISSLNTEILTYGTLSALQDKWRLGLIQILDVSVGVIYAEDPDKNPEIIRRQTVRPFKSYITTARLIADTLTGIGFINASAISDWELVNNTDVRNNIRLAWLNTAGIQGRHSFAYAPSYCEAAGIDYIGHPPGVYLNSDSKRLADQILIINGIPTPRSIIIEDPKDVTTEIIEKIRALTKNKNPYIILKPIYGRGSVGVERIDLSSIEPDDLLKKIRNASEQFSGGIKLDEYLSGREVTVSAIRTSDEIIIFPIIERHVSEESGIFTSLDKVAVSGRATILDPNAPDYQQIVDTVVKTYLALSFEGLCRIDLRQGEEDGEYAVIDTNPKPDLGTAQNISLTQISADYIGMSFPELIKFILLCKLDIEGQGLINRLSIH